VVGLVAAFVLVDRSREVRLPVAETAIDLPKPVSGGLIGS
jgi:hypothetical protein